MKVCKFGGTSLAGAEQVRTVCRIVLSDPQRRIVVVSAPGKRHPRDTKVTDLLIALAEARLVGEDVEQPLQAVVARYGEIAEALGAGKTVAADIRADLEARLQTGGLERGRFVDLVKAAGEDYCARLVAGVLSAMGAKAAYVSPKEAGLLLSDEPGNARVLPESYRNLSALRRRKGVTVFPGFFGHSPSGAVVTFPRGGSDITGSVLAAAVEAEAYENFTDVDSVFAASPALVKAPRAIPELTYREMRELSYAGFTVFHHEALEPVVHAGVPVCIKNTHNPSAPGTRIVPRRPPGRRPVVGIASDAGFCSIYVSKYMMNRELGFGRRLLQILETEGLSYEHAPSGIDNISAILRQSQLDPARQARVVRRIRGELKVDEVSVERDLALIMVVGEGMRHSIGLAARTTGALATAGINIEMINQGSSEVSMMFGVKAADAPAAVRALYEEFFRTE